MAKTQNHTTFTSSNHLSIHAKALVRRAHSSCELCRAKNVKLNILQVTALSDTQEDEIDSCIFICDTCKEQINHPKKRQAWHWRCLYKSIWSNVMAVQVVTVRLLKEMAGSEHWAAELLDKIYLLPEIAKRLDE